MNELKWIWQQTNWPIFTWQNSIILPLLQVVRLKQGLLLGKTGTLVASDQEDINTVLDTLLQNIITSSAIEGETFNVQSVRSSLAKRLGLASQAMYPTSKRSEGLANLLMDAITNIHQPLTPNRLMQWHVWLFSDVDAGVWQPKINIGQLRGDEPMQVVSGRIDKPKVHFEAPPRTVLETELNHFIQWFNDSQQDTMLDPLLRAAICHLWFVTLHPFDDGNGRITRALTDLALAQAEPYSIKLYAMSVAILAKRSAYYDVLEHSQRGSMDITQWLMWFLQTLDTTLQQALDNIDRTLAKTRFWLKNNALVLSAEQRKVLNRLLDGGERGFELGISAAQYQAVAKVSKATATRHLTDLLSKGCIYKLEGGGRNTRYKVLS